MKKTKYEMLLAGIISESEYEVETNVPNLDATTVDQLKSFVAMYRNPRPQEAVHLTGISEPEMAMEAAKLLAVYATNKYKAMESRLKGEIGEALRYEEECDKIYERMPENLKW